MVNNSPGMMTVDEVADYLRVPKNTVYAWRHTGHGPRSMKVGRHVRYRRADVESWLDQQATAAS